MPALDLHSKRRPITKHYKKDEHDGADRVDGVQGAENGAEHCEGQDSEDPVELSANTSVYRYI